MKSLLERPCSGKKNGLLNEDQSARPTCRIHLAALIAVGLGSWIVA